LKISHTFLATPRGYRGYRDKAFSQDARDVRLLIKTNDFMGKERKLVVFLVQERKCIMQCQLRKQRCILLAERDHLWVCAVKDGMLLILNIIMTHINHTRGKIHAPM